ncbi:MAG: response regulator transcription factor [Deltaproteobacteria bacterium]
MESILVVEDEPSIAKGLVHNLRFEGYSVRHAADGETGLDWTISRPPDLMLLDVMLPRLNGFEVLREVRRLDLDVAVIMLTAKGEEHEKVRGLDLGADDYITKPFGLAELLARVRAVLRRRKAGPDEEDRVRFGEVEIDFKSLSVRVRGEPIDVTARELELLKLFVTRAGEAMSREEIVCRVWGYDYEGTDRTLDNFVSRLRKKLEPDAAKPRHFLTVRGIGYRFVAEP